MPQRTVPLLAPPPRTANPEALGSYGTKARGMAVLTNSLLNKSTAFTSEEREALGLTGLLPPVINTLEAQAPANRLQQRDLNSAPSAQWLRFFKQQFRPLQAPVAICSTCAGHGAA